MFGTPLASSGIMITAPCNAGSAPVAVPKYGFEERVELRRSNCRTYSFVPSGEIEISPPMPRKMSWIEHVAPVQLAPPVARPLLPSKLLSIENCSDDQSTVVACLPKFARQSAYPWAPLTLVFRHTT